MRPQQRHLMTQMPRLPHIIGIQERHQLPPRSIDPQIPRAAHPPMRMTDMLHIPHPIRKRRHPPPRHPRTHLTRPVITQQQLHTRQRLSQHALHRLIEEPLRITEDHHHRHHHPTHDPSLAGTAPVLATARDQWD